MEPLHKLNEYEMKRDREDEQTVRWNRSYATGTRMPKRVCVQNENTSTTNQRNISSNK